MTVPVHFIMGMPRSGTTWLSKMLNHHPNVVVFGETLYWGRGFVEPNKEGYYAAEQVRQVTDLLKTRMGPLLRGEQGNLKNIDKEQWVYLLDSLASSLEQTAPTPKELFDEVVRMIAQKEGAAVAVEKTPHHILWLDRILTHYPASRIVVLKREPYSWLLSYKHISNRKHGAPRRIAEQIYHPINAANIWRSYAQAIKQAERWGEQVLVVDYQEIATKAEETSQKIQQHLQVPLYQGLANQIERDNSSFEGQHTRPHLALDDIFWMNTIAARAMTRAGYVQQSQPMVTTILPVLASLARLPMWSWHTYSHLNRVVPGSAYKYVKRRLFSRGSL